MRRRYYQCGVNAVNKTGSERRQLGGTCADAELCCECPAGPRAKHIFNSRLLHVKSSCRRMKFQYVFARV